MIEFLIGKRLASDDQSERKIGVVAGVPALGLDALASSAYGPEAALTVLASIGLASLNYVMPVTLCVMALLSLVFLSYRQTIAAYPSGGGSYTVAKENLGINAGLLAGTALMIDYTLNVAVGISAGVAALTSAVPELHPYTLPLCLLILCVITVANLRGTREAGIVFALPTYVFIASLGGVLLWGTWRSMQGIEPPTVHNVPATIKATAHTLSLWLFLHAFASGCTAMTGVEAVANGVNAFKDPPVKHARATLSVIVGVLSLMLIGIAWLSRIYHVRALDQTQPGYQSVLSQITSAVIDRGIIYYVTMASLLAVLCLSANTSFVGFPRLSKLIAKDKYLPVGFNTVGRRLVYSVGIFFLTVSAGLLLIVFGGITDRLIPLFAVGAFTAFTLSQAGMVMHWHKKAREHPGAKHKLAMCINAIGAVATAVALAIIIFAKFMEGAWIVILAIPVLLATFKAVHRHYHRVASELGTRTPIEINNNEPPIVLLPTRAFDRITRKSIPFGMKLSPDVIAVHLSAIEGELARHAEAELRRDWERDVENPARNAGLPVPRLVVIRSTYRQFTEPLLKYVEEVERESPGRLIAILIPELVKQNWWEFLLHKHRAWRLRSALLHKGDPRLVVITVPWYLH